MAVKNPNIKVVDKYINSKTKILHRCLMHNIEWKTSPCVALQGCGCPACHNEKLRNIHQKTHEEYVTELSIKNPTIEVIEKYAGVNVKIMHHCSIHDIEWKTSPASALQGCGCPECHRQKIHEVKIKSHEQYVNELASKNPNIKVIGRYINTDTPIEHYCNIHNIFWNARPQNLLFGQCCPLCGREKQIKARRKTHEQYVNEVESINPNIEVVGEYINSSTPISHRCKIHGYKWNVSPNGILSGSGCPKCSNNIKKTHEQYIHELETHNPDIEVINTYINYSTPILHRCKIHDVKWKISPAGALNGHGCPTCWRERNGLSRTKLHQEYVGELRLVNPNIEVIDEYKKINIPIKHRCLIDGYEWFTTPQSTLQGSGCPKCHNISHGEQKIEQILNAHKIKYISQKRFQDCKNKKTLPFDFYLPDYNYCIEYDGEQHFKPKEHFGGQKGFEIRVKNDNIKNEYCKENGITLLRIPYYKNIEEELNNFFIYLI